jgi:SHS2 domain-containing protein
MEKFRFFQHTADAKFQAYGKTLGEAFGNAALAVASLMWDWQAVDPRTKHLVEIQGKDLEQLLVNFLEEILYLLDVKMFLLHAAEDIVITNHRGSCSLKGIFYGDIQSGQYEVVPDVKAITYNEMKIEKNDHCMVQVVADV